MSRIVLIAGVLAAASYAGCHRPGSAPVSPGGASGSKAEQARKQVEALAVRVVTNVASAQVKAGQKAEKGDSTLGKAISVGRVVAVLVIEQLATELAASTKPTAASPPPAPVAQAQPKPQSQPRTAPRPGSPPALKIRVSSAVPHANEADAEEDVLKVAQDALEKRLAELDPPVKYRPSVNELKNEFIRASTRGLRDPDPAIQAELAEQGINTRFLHVEYDIEVSTDQLRELRTRDRLSDSLRVLATLSAITLAGFLFLRLDEWTRGHLTRVIAIGATVLAAGAAAALYLV